MPYLPQMRVIVLAPFVRALAQLGVPVEPLLGRVGLPLPGETDDNALVPSTSLFRFLENVARVAGVEGLGLHAGSAAEPEDLGWYGRLLLNSLTGADMLSRSTWLIRSLHSGQVIWAEPSGNDLRVCLTFHDGLQEGRREAECFTLLASLNTIRVFAGGDWRPLEVEFQSSADQALRRHEVLSEARILPGRSRTSFLVPREILSRPIPPSRRSRPPCPPDLQAEFMQNAPAICFANSVRQMVRTLLPNAPPVIEQTAEAACVSVRTLQRRLAEDGLTYARLLDQVRFDRACELLGDRTVRLVDVAFELGYTDQSNFSRAFRRWTGTSPAAYRRGLLKDAAGSSVGPRQAPAVEANDGVAAHGALRRVS